jgi:hypothetical protein
MALKTYDPNQVSISLAGILFKGFAEDEFVRVEASAEFFLDVVGVDGEDVTRSKTGDRRATVTIMLMQSSEVNDLLSALLSRDDAAPGGAGVGAFYMRDRSGRTVVEGTQSWLIAPPQISFGKQAGSREWKIRIAKARRVDGGN